MNNDRRKVAFIFSVNGGALLSFVGDGAQQVNPSPNTATQPVNEVVFSIGIEGVPDNRFQAAGTCKYGNAFAGVTQITCTASTDKGDFSARFTTSGKPPRPGF
ncbi:MAG: hypothetical protein JHD15_00735 [Phenylobacterium sp.]|uniref:hypothetical protein n=1 Tax=Phenylobacterium sp. TaxID=1871053 RepID=UPI001A2049F6|nr:hypothetical protein [Phenylobacterium sp.]MBJ7408882.1 hypothetical protein [Phenylobacterium sp.]